MTVSGTSAPSQRAVQPSGSSVSRPRVDQAAAVDGGRARRGAAQDGRDPGDHLARAERLDHIVVGAELDAEHPVDLLVARGQEQDRQLALRAQRRQTSSPSIRGMLMSSMTRAGACSATACQRRLAVGGLDRCRAPPWRGRRRAAGGCGGRRRRPGWWAASGALVSLAGLRSTDRVRRRRSAAARRPWRHDDRGSRGMLATRPRRREGRPAVASRASEAPAARTSARARSSLRAPRQVQPRQSAWAARSDRKASPRTAATRSRNAGVERPPLELGQRHQRGGAEPAQVAEVELHAAAADLAGVAHVPARRRRRRGRPRSPPPAPGPRPAALALISQAPLLAAQQPPDDQRQADRDQPHPEQGGDAQPGQRVGLDVVEGAQHGRGDQEDVLRHPEHHQPADPAAAAAVGVPGRSATSTNRPASSAVAISG